MVSVPSEQVRRDAEQMFRDSALPATFSFFERLSPVNQRLFVVELWDALAKVAIDDQRADADDLVTLIEGWEATADLDAAPEVIAAIRAPKEYQRLDLD
ncbi:MAG: hypothetical protein WD800_06990 [Dehalococcoidia bacterium]